MEELLPEYKAGFEKKATSLEKCPGCNSAEVLIFHEINNLPAHSVLLISTKEEAINYPKGNIALGFCKTCGFIYNISFDSSIHEYSSAYESTQGYSTTFNVFAKKLAQNLIDRYNLYKKDIIEIGCGQGEFLTLLCQLGKNRGIGFDPAYRSEKNENVNEDQITFIKDFYSEKYVNIHCDFLCCRMTLEHIHETGDFIRILRSSIQNKTDTTVFFQVPNVVRILRDIEFCDIYYEHCSYFSPGSLARLFRGNGFDVIDIWEDYEGQYIMLEAKPGIRKESKPLPQEDDVTALNKDIEFFTKNVKHRLGNWKLYFQNARENGLRVVLWGGGSKGVAFLTTLNIQDEIEYVVDINPNKHGTFMAGSGQEIIGPEFLKKYKPDVVIVMNPIYCKEINEELERIGVKTELKSI